jgi:type II secretory pathway predicted ATPase ExeA
MNTQAITTFSQRITSVEQLPKNLLDLDLATPMPDEFDDEDRIENTVMAFRANLVRHMGFEKALKEMARCHRMGRYRLDEPNCLLITGESGCGKSTLRRTYVNQYPRLEVEDRTLIPVLHLELPSQPTVKNVAERLLIQLGDPFAEKGSAEGKTARIVTLMKECGVELVVLDEFQHFVDRSSEKVEYKVADWLKSVINDSKVPFVLMGLPRCHRILEVNEQLRRRFLPRVSLHRFRIDIQEERRQFFTVLKNLEKSLPLQSPSALCEKTVVPRIYYATHGVIDHTMKLISESLNIALSEHRPTIDQDILRRAFERVIWAEARDQDNPFHQAFKDRHLNRAGEPFYGYQ